MRFSSDTRQAAALTLATWVLSGALYLIPFSLAQGAPGLYVAVSVVLICTLGACFSAGVFAAARAVRRAPWPARIAGVGAAVLAASALLALADGLASGLLAAQLDPDARRPAFALRAINNFVALIWQFALLGAVYTVLESNNLARERERLLAEAREAASRAEAAASAARLAALRYQLNPHFLFNTLNAISSLIVTRCYAEADAMLAKLSEFLRATLAADPEGLIAIEDELAALQHYLEIETVRFEDRLGVDFACPAELNTALVPSFLLQPLVENAIKHAVAPASRPVTIRVEVAREGEDLVIVVEDDGEGAGAPASTPARSGTGVGLVNVRQRLHVLYGERGVLETVRRAGGFLAMVRLPLARRAAPAEAAA